MPRQSWFDALQMFRLCAACGHVYHDNTPSVPGQQCPRCHTESASPNPYFVATISDVADLIAKFYQLPNLDVHPTITPPPLSRANALAILVFFCTLGEILLQHFLERAMQKLDLPPDVQQRLLDDNLFTKQRVQKLFPTLCGVKWNDAIKAISINSPDNFESTASFFLDASEHRNRLLHLGNTWQPPLDIAKQCFEHIAPLINLFVALHNIYLVRKL